MKLVGIESKKKILQRAKSLSSGKFTKVFIARDLTKKQQEHDKDLREHVKLFREEYKDQEIKIKIKGGKSCKKRAGITGYSPVRSQEGNKEGLKSESN